ncbi:MAG: arylsulfatase [Armatimonadetes bacterium]|nr:arylsulfatase [Armatimonadota bacterium]
MLDVNRRSFLLGAALGSAAATLGGRRAEAAPRRPNVVYLLADDLGYGDVRCLNPNGQIPTPNMDRLAREGLTFTDCHSGSAVCTPSRYGLLTGRYAWRTRLQNGVLGGGSRSLIAPRRLTVAAMLKAQGYRTACFGKWHLGLDWVRKPGAKGEEPDTIDYTQPFANGPTQLGFDEYYGIAASLDMPPYTWLEGDRVTVQPTATKKWIRQGPAAPDFEAVDVLPGITQRAVSFLEARAKEPEQPFFLYLPLNSPHTPIEPTKAWRGKSKLNPYADFVMQTDDTLGQVTAALDRLGLADNTIVVFTSDNGCSPQADYPTLLAKGHNPSYHFRGTKADIWDGGHRIPFLLRWPAQVKAGTTTDQLTCLVDLTATMADLLSIKLPDDAAEDSHSLRPLLDGRADQPVRESVVHHSINGSFAIRAGQWKLEFCPGSGGWSDPKPGSPAEKGLPPIQLYDMTADVGERRNLQAEQPEVVARLTAMVRQQVTEGRSTPGARQANDVRVKFAVE